MPDLFNTTKNRWVMRMKIAAKHDMASLDVLRGVAILLVILAHFMPGTVPYELPLTIALGNAA